MKLLLYGILLRVGKLQKKSMLKCSVKTLIMNKESRDSCIIYLEEMVNCLDSKIKDLPYGSGRSPRLSWVNLLKISYLWSLYLPHYLVCLCLLHFIDKLESFNCPNHSSKLKSSIVKSLISILTKFSKRQNFFFSPFHSPMVTCLWPTLLLLENKKSNVILVSLGPINLFIQTWIGL